MELRELPGTNAAFVMEGSARGDSENTETAGSEQSTPQDRAGLHDGPGFPELRCNFRQHFAPVCLQHWQSLSGDSAAASAGITGKKINTHSRRNTRLLCAIDAADFTAVFIYARMQTDPPGRDKN